MTSTPRIVLGKTPHPTPHEKLFGQTLIIAPPIAIIAPCERRIINNFFSKRQNR
ncbi:hypothetical protein IQ224_05095 [Microcystis sp. LEGE 00066]|uniref:Uncharacterized protein n=1 Tax=Microcystis aeruginosa PCC 7806SL TaxID=1903187 RepID=A0AB33C2V0_MICA7|nr:MULTISPECIES: hypothetical protein [Microcystis]ARI82851.1 hypothetical protein BH695_3572 [Microcystis aeruginosa PCC 7806SL]ELS49037.1 hypothetical protein C789_1161 [Microcystis aeruginosa FACHB-905 = DIANCHI905]MBE9261616.1 hypothetical protein [Microcystis sp. LEGE 00066]MDB9430485.1 hypothetical protein [Microcystis aeruginosa CS-555/01A07]